MELYLNIDISKNIWGLILEAGNRKRRIQMKRKDIKKKTHIPHKNCVES